MTKSKLIKIPKSKLIKMKPETNTFIGMRMFPNVHHREFPYVQKNPHYYPRIFYQLLCTDREFLVDSTYIF